MADNHYAWLDENLESFFSKLGIDTNYAIGIVSAHGDKCYSYEDKWKKAGIPFAHGVAIFLLSYIQPYSKEVRQTENGWVNVCDWVIANHPKFSQYLNPA